ncbi:Uncharacterised protein [Streptomyces griseus]|uniref:Uncharacterized protein n=1 Tax=Streptomyces griseus TaxID=1911 RepID=A0A380MQ75_STRGR|nr:Uncharacterised protein [Streptomyces griseus]
MGEWRRTMAVTPEEAPVNRIDDGAAWPEQGGPTSTHVHDPFEVTIQMDGIGRHLEGAHRPRGAHAKPQSRPLPEPADGPVFVDESGRRGRHLRRLGLACGLAFAGYAVVVVATLFSGNSSAPWLPLPGPEADRPAGGVDTPGLPEEPAGAPADPADPADETAPAAGTNETPEVPAEDAPDGTGLPAGTAPRPDTPADPAPGRTAPAAPRSPEPSETGAPGTPVEPSRPQESPEESADPSADPEAPPADGGDTAPQARPAAFAPHPVPTLARAAPAEENQAA